MKRLVSLLVMVAMLAGMCVTAGAAVTVPSVNEFDISDTTNWSSYNRVQRFYGKLDGSTHGVPGKYGDDIYGIYQTNAETTPDMTVTYKGISGQTFAEGEKVHITTEIMIPETTHGMHANYSGFGVGIGAKGLTGESASATTEALIRAANTGEVENSNKLLSMDFRNHRFNVLGVVHTDTRWEFGTWYRLDAVITFGATPRASFYVNGAPLAVNSDYGNSTPVHGDNNSNATFDGVHTSSEDILIGSGGSDGSAYTASGIWGLGNINTLHMVWNRNSEDSSDTKVYFDNTCVSVLGANDQADIPSPLKIDGTLPGGTVVSTDLAAATVTPSSWYAHKTAKVTVSVDGGTAFEATTAPFTFDLSGANTGFHNVEIKALDAIGNVLDSSTQTLAILPPAETIYLYGNSTKTAPNDFSSAAWYDVCGAYYGSTPKNVADNSETRAITANETIKDHDNALKIFSKGDAAKFTYGVYNANLPIYREGIVKLQYDMYLKDNKISTLTPMFRDGYALLIWDDTNKKMVTNTTAWSALGYNQTQVVIDPVYDQWQTWEWTFNLYTNTASLEINDSEVIKDLTYQASGGGFQKFLISVQSTDTTDGSYIGLDNLAVTYHPIVPAITAVDLGENAKGNLVKADTTAINLQLVGDGLVKEDLESKIVVNDGTANLEGVTVTADVAANTVALTGLSLEAGKTYTVTLPVGVYYGQATAGTNDYATVQYETAAASSYSFNAVESLPADDGIDDGVAGDIAVSAARFTINNPSIWKNPVATYTGGTIAETWELRADLEVSNAATTKKDFSVVVATYSGDKLVNIAINSASVLPKAEKVTVTSAPIVVGTEENLTAKAFLVEDMNSFAPISYSYDILGNVAQ